MTRFVDREPRQEVWLQVRVHGDDGWSDAVIGNACSRGLMLQSARTPGRRSFVEIRRQNVCIVGRVVWSRGGRCGIVTQDRVDIEALKAGRARVTTGKSEDRRLAPRAAARPPAPTCEDRADAARRWGGRFEFAMLLAALAGCGLVLADTAMAALREPVARATLAMAGRR